MNEGPCVKEGAEIMPDFTFIDKTLGYALKQKRINIRQFINLKQKISRMSNVIFDIPFDFAVRLKGSSGLELNDVRACIGRNARQVKKAQDLGITRLRISLENAACPESYLPWSKVLAEADKLQMKISVGCLDLAGYSTAERAFFQELVNKSGIESVVIHDWSSKLDALDTYRRLWELKQVMTCNLEYEGKNFLGLATGNVLGAVRSGINAVSTSLGGIGDFPAFEEVVMSMSRLLKIPVTVPRDIAVICKEILECMGLGIPRTKPVIGSNIFAHESGIHVDGIIKKSELYEPFAPDEVGLYRKIVIGKHSGRGAIEQNEFA